MNTKRCPKCGEWKEATRENFHVDASGVNGLHSRCKVCRKRDSQKYRVENHEKELARHRRYKQSHLEMRRAKDRLHHKLYWQAHREEIGAKRSKTGGRIRRGVFGYHGAHDRVVRSRGSASQFTCTFCSDPAREWGLDPCADVRNLRVENMGSSREGQVFSISIDDYRPVCHIHNALDGHPTLEGWSQKLFAMGQVSHPHLLEKK